MKSSSIAPYLGRKKSLQVGEIVRKGSLCLIMFLSNGIKRETYRMNTVEDEIEEKIKVMAKGCTTTLQVNIPQLIRLHSWYQF